MKYSILLYLSLIIVSCNNNDSPRRLVSKMDTSQNEAFDVFKEKFVEDLWQQYPDWAASKGYNKYRHVLKIPNEITFQENHTFCTEKLKALNQFDKQQLSIHNQIDYRIIANQLEKTLWHLATFKSHQWNPSIYNVGGSFSRILSETYKPLPERLLDFKNRLEAVPAYFEAAKNNITHPSIIHTELALSQNKGTMDVFSQKITDSLAVVEWSLEDKNAFQKTLKKAQLALKDYIAFLNSLLKESKNENSDIEFRDFRIGKALFSQKFNYDIVSSLSASDVFQKALAHKKLIHKEMIIIANNLWDTYYPQKKRPEDKLAIVKQVINKISENHVKQDEFVSYIKQQIPELEAFVKEKDLLTLDPEKPLQVRETPVYMRGVSGASISAPGPYDANRATFYNVTPLDHYTKEQAESYLREYNDYILQILNIHEAIPGHYTQLVYSNKAPSIIKAVFSNDAMVEGWAVYTERMMLEEGYGNNTPEMWLMYYKWNLRVTCNTIIDYGIHALNYNKEQVLNILKNEAFQEEIEAQGKWRRARLTQVQLCSYFTGFREIYDLREIQKRTLQEKFDLKIFHESFLSYGSVPVKYIKELMIK